MTQYLIRHITDTTGHPFVEVIKPRENERYEIVSAESKEEAKEKVKADIRAKVLRQVIKDFKDFKDNILNKKGQ
ncbi:DUF1381 domain-containing protein [Staphylococcus saprophyticus]|uniref:DUF1381 domain-containing protein n=1 Tax=Staphylococcus saprophyticus TaxID=29385 RepID=UPI0034DCE909